MVQTFVKDLFVHSDVSFHSRGIICSDNYSRFNIVANKPLSFRGNLVKFPVRNHHFPKAQNSYIIGSYPLTF